MKRFAIAAAVLLLAAPAHAQNAQLTDAEVREFIQKASQEGQQLAQAGDWRGIQSWHEKHLAEDARLAVKAVLVTRKGPVVNFEATLEGKTLERFTNMLMVSPEQIKPESIKDYTLNAEVRHVAELPGGGAGATVIFYEAGTIAVAAPAKRGKARAEPAGREGQERKRQIPTERVVFQTISMCSLRLAKAEAETIKIEMAACETITTMG